MTEFATFHINYNIYRGLFTILLCCIPYVFLYYVLEILGLVLLYTVVTRIWNRFMTTSHPMEGSSVFITGCDSGMGHTFAKHLDQVGFTVFAGCLDDKGEGAQRLKNTCSKRTHIVQIDISKDESIDKARKYVEKNLTKKGLLGLVNNAGIDMDGEVELTPIWMYEKCFNVNLYGTIRVTKAFLPLIRKTKGRIVNITSVRGRMNEPRQATYAASKHGVETISDSLRMEMRRFGVKVSIVEPGEYSRSTSIENEVAVKRKMDEVEEMWNTTPEEVKRGYTKNYVMSWVHKASVKGWVSMSCNMTNLSKAVEHALCNGNPKSRYLVDGSGSYVSIVDEYAVLCRVYNILPTWLIDGYISIWTKCDQMS